MKNKRGFTLVELLAIIVLLSIIMMVAAPNLIEEGKRSKEEENKILNEKIDNAAHLYAAKYYADKIVDLPNCENNYIISFTIDDLEQDGLLDLSDDQCVVDEKNKEEQNIEISYKNDSIEYDYSKLGNLENCYNKK